MDATTVYSFRRPLLSLRLELHDDSIQATGSRNYAEFDTTISLVRLDPHPDRAWVHDARFYIGIWSVIVAVLLFLGVSMALHLNDYRGSYLGLYEVVGVPAAIGYGLVMLYRGKLEHVLFKSELGIPALAIPRDPRKGAEFDQFISRLVERIRALRDDRDHAPRD